MSKIKKPLGSTLKQHTRTVQDSNEELFAEILQSKAHWEEAYMYFEEALGEDQVDYAIYMLEAAERKYQMHLKQAKKLGVVANNYLGIKNQRDSLLGNTLLNAHKRSSHMKGE